MASKDKASRLEQKAYFETKLNERVDLLKEQGVDQAAIAKDAVVKKLRADLRDTTARLAAIDDLERKKEEMAAAKAEKLAAPKKKKEKKKQEEEPSAESKRQQKKKKKKEGKPKE